MAVDGPRIQTPFACPRSHTLREGFGGGLGGGGEWKCEAFGKRRGGLGVGANTKHQNQPKAELSYSCLTYDVTYATII